MPLTSWALAWMFGSPVHRASCKPCDRSKKPERRVFLDTSFLGLWITTMRHWQSGLWGQGLLRNYIVTWTTYTNVSPRSPPMKSLREGTEKLWYLSSGTDGFWVFTTNSGTNENKRLLTLWVLKKIVRAMKLTLWRLRQARKQSWVWDLIPRPS